MTKLIDQLPLSPKLLGISDVVINDVKAVRGGSIYITVSSTKSKTIFCQYRLPTEPYEQGRLLTLHHLPMFGDETYIQIEPTRDIYKHCDDHPVTILNLMMII